MFVITSCTVFEGVTKVVPKMSVFRSCTALVEAGKHNQAKVVELQQCSKNCLNPFENRQYDSPKRNEVCR